MRRRDHRSDPEPQRRERRRAEHRDRERESRMRQRQAGDRSHDRSTGGQHDERGDHALEDAHHDLFDGDQRDRDGRQQSIFDLARPPEVLHHWQGDGLHRRQRQAHRDHARQERRRVASRDEPHLRQHVPEDDDEQHRLHDRANQEERQLAAQHVHVAAHEGEKDRMRRHRRRLAGSARERDRQAAEHGGGGGRCRQSSSRPVSEMNRASSVPPPPGTAAFNALGVSSASSRP